VPPGIAYSNGLPEPSVRTREEGWVKTNKDFFDKKRLRLHPPDQAADSRGGLNDSPAGLFAWIIEKRRTWRT